MLKHELKTDSAVFQAVQDGLKTYEIRRNDRDFVDGDELVLRETKYTGVEMKDGFPLEYTGRELTVTVSHILRGPIYGLEEGWVIMSFIPTPADYEKWEALVRSAFSEGFKAGQRKPKTGIESQEWLNSQALAALDAKEQG